MAMGIGGKVQVFIENDMTAAMAPAAYIQRTADDGWMACRILDMDTHDLSLIHISEPTRLRTRSRMPSSA